MVIEYYDGSTLECSEIEFSDNSIIADGYRIIPFYEILRIYTA